METSYSIIDANDLMIILLNLMVMQNNSSKREQSKLVCSAKHKNCRAQRNNSLVES